MCLIYGKWLVQTNERTHTHAQRSLASVGFAQARPNKSVDCTLLWLTVFHGKLCAYMKQINQTL